MWVFCRYLVDELVEGVLSVGAGLAEVHLTGREGQHRPIQDTTTHELEHHDSIDSGWASRQRGEMGP